MRRRLGGLRTCLRHCERTGRANARPMPGFREQSISPQRKHGLLRRFRSSQKPSYSAKADYPVRRGFSTPSLAPRNTGSPAFAGDDGCERGGLIFIRRAFALATRSARGVDESSAPLEGAGNAGCALHPRSRVQNGKRKRTRAYRFSGGHPTFPAQWFDGL